MSHKNLAVKVGMFLTAGGLLLGAASVASTSQSAAREVDPRSWTELDIVPMPKNIRLTDDNLALDPAKVVLMIGADAGRQSRIGADWINQRLKAVGGADALSILAGVDIPADKTAIIIGTIADNPLIARAADEKTVNIGVKNPGERGYEIRRSTDGKRIYLAGADDIGALYACVTFGELLECRNQNTVIWRAAEVRDWPDLIWMVSPYTIHMGRWSAPKLWDILTKFKPNANLTPELVAAYQEAIQEHYDYLLRRKYSLLCYRIYANGLPFKPGKYYEIVKAGIEYGRERGIEAEVHAESPFAGRKELYPEIAAERICPTKQAPTVFRYDKEWIRCWSLDDLTRKTARNLAELVNAVGYTHVALHDTDTGGYANPAQWEDRCAVCRERWGDDYAAATINKLKIYYEEIKKLNPDARVHLVLFPYDLSILDPGMDDAICALPHYGNTPESRELVKRYRARIVDLYSQAHAAFPLEDVTFCTRESYAASNQALRDLTPGRGISTWLGLMSHAWRPLFSEAAVWSATFIDNPRDLFGVVAYLDDVIPLESFAVREYSWNKETPGARTWDRIGFLGGVRAAAHPAAAEEWRHAEPKGEIYDLILPRLARNCFSAAAAPFITRTVSQNIDLRQIFNLQNKQCTWLNTPEKMQWQLDNVAHATQAMDELWVKIQQDAEQLGLDEFSLTLVVNLRERLHIALWTARARLQNLRALELSAQGNRTGAEAAVAAGLEYCRAGVADRERLVAERPAGVAPPEAMYLYLDKAILFNSFENPEAELKATGAQIDAIATAVAIPEAIVQELAQNRMVRATRVVTPPSMGNRADSVWRAAWPVEPFLALKSPIPRPALAHTTARLLYDADNLYLWLTAFVSSGEKVSSNDGIELFLQPPKFDGGYLHFFMYANGKMRRVYHRPQAVGMGAGLDLPEQAEWVEGVTNIVHWNAGSWDTWLKIPLQELGDAGAEGWRINLARVYPMAYGKEYSSIQKFGAKSFHGQDVGLFPALTWNDDPCPAASVELMVSDFNVKTMTLPDGIASVASFKLTVKSDRILHDVKLTAEAYDDTGKMQGRMPLATLERVMYDWQAPNDYAVGYVQVQQQGGVLIKLESMDGNAVKLERFGGWKGTPDSQK